MHNNGRQSFYIKIKPTCSFSQKKNLYYSETVSFEKKKLIKVIILSSILVLCFSLFEKVDEEQDDCLNENLFKRNFLNSIKSTQIRGL